MKKIAFLLLLPVAMLMVSCRSSKNATKDSKNNNTTTTVTTKTPQTLQQTNFTAKVKATIGQAGKDLTTSGTLRMRRDDVIQLTLVDPFLGVAEVGRLELTPDSILIIDRMNKRYVLTSYSEFEPLRSRGIDFGMVQEYFWQQAMNNSEVSYTIPLKTEVRFELQLSDKGSSDNWDAHTSVSGKYTRTDANRLFNSLVGQ